MMKHDFPFKQEPDITLMTVFNSYHNVSFSEVYSILNRDRYLGILVRNHTVDGLNSFS